MTTTCPNCSHPIRTGAKFCGFCGTDLESYSAPHAADASLQDDSSATAKSKRQKGGAASSRDPWRTISIIAIVLLVLVIVTGLFIQYWGLIFPFLVQFISSLTG